MYTKTFQPSKRAWVAKYKKANGKWGNYQCPKNIGIHQPLEADRQIISFLAGVEVSGTTPAKGTFIKPAALTLAFLAPKWLEYRKNDLHTAKNTWVGFKQSLNNWILDNEKFPHFSIQNLDIEAGELSVQMLLKWIDTLTGKPSTRQGKIACLRSFLDDAIAKEWLDPNMENPTKKPAIEKVLAQFAEQKDEDKVIAHLTQTQWGILLSDEAVLSEYRKLRYLVDGTHGFRDSELQGLTWEDIDWKAMTITCNKQLEKRGCLPWIHEKDLKLPKDKYGDLPNAIMGKPKTANSRRTLPLHSVTAKALKYWFEKGWGVYVGRKPTIKDPIFPRGYNGRRDFGNPGEFCFSDSAELFRKDLLRLNLPDTFTDRTKGITVNLTFHCIRHTFSHLLEASGADDIQIGVLMGHASKSVTRNNYIAKNLEVFRKLVEAIPLPEAIPLQYTTIGTPKGIHLTAKAKPRGNVIPIKSA